MKNPKFFVTLIFVLGFILLLIDLPIIYNLGKFKLPFSRKTQDLSKINLSKIDFNIGAVKFKKDLNYKLGLDLQGGTRLEYKVDMANIPSKERDTAFESARNVIDKRINFFGVTEPTIQSIKLPNEYRIAVELPGTSNVNQALELIGKTAELTFWEEGAKKIASNSAEAIFWPYGATSVFTNEPLKTKLTGKDLKSAKVVFGSQNGKPEVQLNFSSEGSKLFADITKRNVGKRVAIALDNIIIEAPVVQQAILNGNAVITGSFNTDTAKSLSIQLNAGALPAPLVVKAQNTVGPSLGIESLKKSLLGGFLGFLSVIVFMIYLYRKEGVLASVALIIYAIITLFIFKFIPITLTLAGIAGFILSIGMAVDANILIFERMKEELRAGKPRNIALKLGFTRAWSSIRDSNVSSLITTFILFYFGTGAIRGFALTLAVGILVSMFSAIIVTRNLLTVFDQSENWFGKLRKEKV